MGTNNTLSTTFNSAITEEQLLMFFTILKSFSTLISKECASAVLPFLCQYVYPPCDDDGSVHFLTQEQCVNIRDQVCVSEWRIAMATELGLLLPVCEVIGNDFNLSVQDVNRSESLNCHYQFQDFCGVCLPLCDTFSQYTDQVNTNENIVIITADALAVIGGVIVLVVAVIRRKEM